MIRFAFFTLAITLAILSYGLALEPPAKEAVSALEKAWAAATVQADATALGKILANDLNYIHSTGLIDSKTMFIDKLKSGQQKYFKLQHEGMEVRLYGSTAVVTATALIESSTKGLKNPPGRLRFMHVWYYSKGAWQLVAHQSLRLP
ncbi:MAG: nuclear transport factor 2 family protein [Bryobacteraceae bacterium]|nr:nuclear transport factor 2 family protein [Bryobacteraceae bacterium]